LPATPPSGTPLLRLLFIDDAPTDYSLLVRYLEVGGLKLHSARVENAVQMREALAGATWDAVLCELDLPGFSYADALALLRETHTATPLIVVTGERASDADAAAQAMVAGAGDFIQKSRLKRLLPALQRCIAAEAVASAWRDDIDKPLAELAADASWLAANAADDAARARAQQMQLAIERARVCVARRP
jgi:DNA-binding NtrC family response regulator